MQKLRRMDESGGWFIYYVSLKRCRHYCGGRVEANTFCGMLKLFSHKALGKKVTWTWSLCRTSTMWIRKRCVKELVNPAGTLELWFKSSVVAHQRPCVCRSLCWSFVGKPLTVCSAHKDLIITKTSENDLSLQHSPEKMSLYLLKLGWISMTLLSKRRYCRVLWTKKVQHFAYITVWQTFLHVRCHHSDGKLSTSAYNPDLSVRTHTSPNVFSNRYLVRKAGRGDVITAKVNELSAEYSDGTVPQQ